MAKNTSTAKSNSNAATLDFEKTLFKAAGKLQKNIGTAFKNND